MTSGYMWYLHISDSGYQFLYLLVLSYVSTTLSGLWSHQWMCVFQLECSHGKGIKCFTSMGMAKPLSDLSVSVDNMFMNHPPKPSAHPPCVMAWRLCPYRYFYEDYRQQLYHNMNLLVQLVEWLHLPVQLYVKEMLSFPGDVASLSESPDHWILLLCVCVSIMSSFHHCPTWVNPRAVQEHGTTVP